MERNYIISVTVELDPAEYNRDDVFFQKHAIKRAIEKLCPEAAVSVRAGQVQWFDLETAA